MSEEREHITEEGKECWCNPKVVHVASAKGVNRVLGAYFNPSGALILETQEGELIVGFERDYNNTPITAVTITETKE